MPPILRKQRSKKFAKNVFKCVIKKIMDFLKVNEGKKGLFWLSCKIFSLVSIYTLNNPICNTMVYIILIIE